MSVLSYWDYTVVFVSARFWVSVSIYPGLSTVEFVVGNIPVARLTVTEAVVWFGVVIY